ncbi:MAG TPA: DUF222 domain-containing protein [Lapillicoccus sp.]|nr:DUF222 domain-containing protein [Lapillicoccus sp.]
MDLPAAVVLRQREIDDVEIDVSVVAARLNRDHAELVELTRTLLDGERWAGGGIRSPEHWLMVRAGLSAARAADVVRLARRSVELPTTMAAMTAGQLSLDQAAVVARFAPASHEASVGELAPMTTVPQLRRALSRYQFADGVTPDEPVGRDERDVPGTEAYAGKAPELSMSYGDGRFLLRYSAPAEIGALVEQAVREAKDALFAAGQSTVTAAEALPEVACRSMASVESGGRAARYRVYVHLSTEGSWVGGKGAIPASLAAKFACDGVVQPIWEVDGTPVSVGRNQRIVPDRTRRLVEDRDRGCAFPGCVATRFLEVHHVDHWAEGGSTDLDRLVCLCPHHHDAHHRGEFAIEGRPLDPRRLEHADVGGLKFVNAHGWTIRPQPGPTLTVVEPSTGAAAYRGPTGERLQGRWLDLRPNCPLDSGPSP